MEKTTKMLAKLAEKLPHAPHRIWAADAEEILCETEQIAETLADFFDALYGEPTVTTGYYDPEEDRRNRETDERTGFYYVTLG